MLDRRGGPRGAAWSNVKPGRGLGLKKQIPSDCDFRNFRRVDDGAGVCRADRIAAKRTIAIDNWQLLLLNERVDVVGHRVEI
jgi:hypothetical protein